MNIDIPIFISLFMSKINIYYKTRCATTNITAVEAEAEAADVSKTFTNFIKS